MFLLSIRHVWAPVFNLQEGALHPLADPDNIEIVSHKFLISGHSFLPSNHDFGSIGIKIKEANYLYIPEYYYEVIELCRKKNPFLIQNFLG